MEKGYDIKRFYKPHEDDYGPALAEIKRGKKTSHWMWYIFPQLGIYARTVTAVKYAISGRDEAIDFYNDGYLGGHLREICGALLDCASDDAYEIFGHPDNMKLRSCMTLFYSVTGDELFKRVLDKFFAGAMDEATVGFLKNDI